MFNSICSKVLINQEPLIHPQSNGMLDRRNTMFQNMLSEFVAIAIHQTLIIMQVPGRSIYENSDRLR
jgi:hypothetical protein